MLDHSQAHTPNVESAPSEKADVSWRCFPEPSTLLPIRMVLSPQKSWTFHSCSLTHERWCLLIFPCIVWCLRDHHVALSSGFSDHFPSCLPIHEFDDSEKTVPSCCCFWWTSFLPFHSIATSSFDRFPQEANISLEASVGQILILIAVCVVFHSRYQSTLIPLPPSIRPIFKGFTSHFVSQFKCWIIPRPIYPMWNQLPH